MVLLCSLLVLSIIALAHQWALFEIELWEFTRNHENSEN